MSHLAEAHTQWHAIHGPYAVCPLDCGRISPEQAEAEARYDAIDWEDEHGTASIRCAHCPRIHRSVEAVRLCAAA